MYRGGTAAATTFLILVSAVAACAHPYEKYFPLKEGNRWTFEGEYPGPAVAARSYAVDTHFSTVYHLTEFPGFPQGLWVAFAGHTLYAWDPAAVAWVQFLRFGAPTGTSYQVTLKHAGWWNVATTLESKSASLHDPYLATTFQNCVRFKIGSGSFVFAPNVGLVRWSSGSTARMLRTARLSGQQLGTGIDQAGTRIPWHGGDRWLLGANYPWLHYGNDFGGNAWGAYGVHAGGAYAAHMADMKSKGVRVARWFVFTDLRAGVTFDWNGMPTGLDAWAIQDLEAALGLAKSSNVHLVLVLFDFGMLKKSKIVNGVVTGGRTDLLTDPNKSQALLDKVIAPVLKKFARHPNVIAWEIMNEPEWGIADLPAAQVMSEMNPMTMAQFWSFASRVSAAIHAVAGAHSTIGSTSLKWHKVWTNSFAMAKGLPPLNLDFYQTHYYPWMDSGSWTGHPALGTTKWSPLQQKLADIALDRPMIVGEAQMNTGAGAKLDKLLANGYAGVLAWSYLKDFAVDWASFTPWGSAHSGIVTIPP